jgi:predicted AlkP superfamily pyrophosphatase or phosphodiesterase
MDKNKKENTDLEIQLEKEQGEAYSKALELMKKETVHQEVEINDFIITVLAHGAEGYYVTRLDGALEWRVPQPEENQHIEVVVRDKQDLRFIPDLSVSCRLFSSDGYLIDEKTQPFIWHPFLYHYGINWELPGRDNYTAEISIMEPIFGRHDRQKGKRYGENITIKIGPLPLMPQRQEHETE